MSLTVLLAAPPNPAQLEFAAILNRYQFPHFQQNWQLFAPTPMNDERLVIVRARVRTPDAVYFTEFVDLTSPEVAKSHRYRIFAPKTPRIGLNLLQLILWRDPVAERVRESFADELPSGDDPDLLSPYEKIVIDQADTLLERYLCLSAASIWGNEQNQIEAVQARLVVNEFPPFSRRYEPNSAGEIDVRPFPWMDGCPDIP